MNSPCRRAHAVRLFRVIVYQCYCIGYSRHLFVPRQVTGDADKARTFIFTVIPVIATLPAQPTACTSPPAERDLCVGQYNTRLADVGKTSDQGL